MFEFNRKKIYTITGLVASLAMGAFIFIQLQNIQPSNQQLQNELTNSINSIDTQPIQDQLNLISNRVDVSSYSSFEIQQLDNENSLLEISKFNRETLAFTRIETLQPVLSQDELFDRSTNYYILNYKTGRIFFIGYGLDTELTQYTTDSKTIWVFGMTNYSGTYNIYSLDQNFNTITSYKLPENENLQSIDLTQKDIISATYKNTPENTSQTTYSNTYSFKDLKVESTIQISPEKTLNIPVASINTSPEST